jgi:hypothetical protein
MLIRKEEINKERIFIRKIMEKHPAGIFRKKAAAGI